MKRHISAFLLAAACSYSTQAAVISTSGTLQNVPVGAYALYNFNVTTAGFVDLLLEGDTDAWLGVFSGTNNLSNATFINQNDDDLGSLNSFLNLNLGVGSYTAWITTHGSYWDIDNNSIAVEHDHTPMSYTLTITGDVTPNDVTVPSSVPEPASTALFGLGLAGAWLSRRRKK